MTCMSYLAYRLIAYRSKVSASMNDATTVAVEGHKGLTGTAGRSR